MAEQRAYPVKELDALRHTVENKLLWGCYDTSNLGGGVSVTFSEETKNKVVEERVRTHMLAGQTAQDLIDSEKPFNSL